MMIRLFWPILALLDSSLITSVRTGLCAAMATDLLADRSATNLAIIGAGHQNMMQLDYLLNLRDFQEMTVFDLDRPKAEAFRKVFSERIRCQIAPSISECVDGAEVIMTATWSKKPILEKSMISMPCHITSLGSDEKEKVEVSRDLVLNSDFYCDDIALNMLMGTPGNLDLPSECIRAEIGQVFANPALAERDRKPITIYSSVGLPFQDLITAWHVYNKALGDNKIARVKLN